MPSNWPGSAHVTPNAANRTSCAGGLLHISASTWRDVETLLMQLGAEREEGEGSTVTFVLNERKLTVDRPHPARDCGHGLVKRVRIFLKSTGNL